MNLSVPTERYEKDIEEYARGFDEVMISDLCQVLTIEQISLFEHFIELRRNYELAQGTLFENAEYLQ